MISSKVFRGLLCRAYQNKIEDITVHVRNAFLLIPRLPGWQVFLLNKQCFDCLEMKEQLSSNLNGKPIQSKHPSRCCPI